MPKVPDRSEEQFRRGALFFGATILGLQCGAWLSSNGSLFSQTQLPNAALAPTVALALLFAWGASRSRLALLRGAFLVLSLQRTLVAVSAFQQIPFGDWLLSALTLTAGVLFVLAGARDRRPMTLALAVLTFVVATVVKIAVSSYARWVFNGRSMMGLEGWGVR